MGSGTDHFTLASADFGPCVSPKRSPQTSGTLGRKGLKDPPPHGVGWGLQRTNFTDSVHALAADITPRGGAGKGISLNKKTVPCTTMRWKLSCNVEARRTTFRRNKHAFMHREGMFGPQSQIQPRIEEMPDNKSLLTFRNTNAVPRSRELSCNTAMQNHGISRPRVV